MRGASRFIIPTNSQSRGIGIYGAGDVVGLFLFLLILSALDAYDLGRVPLTWIMQLGAIGCAGYVGLRYRLAQPFAHRRLWLFCFWAGTVTVLNTVFGHYAQFMPQTATTPYPVFVLLRFLSVLSFVASLYLVYWLLVRGSREPIVKGSIVLGSIISVAALYMYVAQVYGLPEPPRTRLGTSGALQAVTFTYDFHRAIGTFREPSLLAAWLLVPLLLSLTIPNRIYFVHSVLMAGTLLLTGSLSAIVSVTIGLLAASLIAVAFDASNLRYVLRALLVVPFAVALFYVFARPGLVPPIPPAPGGLTISSPSPGAAPSPTVLPTGTANPSAPSPLASSSGALISPRSVDIFGTLGRRITDIVRGGFAHSDRAYLYGYLIHNRPPLLGVGLGNANLLLGHYLGAAVIAGFISLYLNTLYATGVIGLCLLGIYLLGSPLRAVRRRRLWGAGWMLFVMAGYVAWLVTFAAGQEELGFMFALVAALLAYEVRSGSGPREETQTAGDHEEP